MFLDWVYTFFKDKPLGIDTLDVVKREQLQIFYQNILKKKKYYKSTTVGTPQIGDEFFDDQFQSSDFQKLVEPKLRQIAFYVYQDLQKNSPQNIVGIKASYVSKTLPFKGAKHMGSFKNVDQIQEINVCLSTINQNKTEQCIDLLVGYKKKTKFVGLKLYITGIKDSIDIGETTSESETLICQESQGQHKQKIVDIGGTYSEFLESFYVVTREHVNQSKILPAINAKNTYQLIDLHQNDKIVLNDINKLFEKFKGRLLFGKEQYLGSFKQNSKIFDSIFGTDIQIWQNEFQNKQYELEELRFSVCQEKGDVTHLAGIQIQYQIYGKPIKSAVFSVKAIQVKNKAFFNETVIQFEKGKRIIGIIGQSDQNGITYLRVVMHDSDLEEQMVEDVGISDEKKQYKLFGDQNCSIIGLGGTYGEFLESLYFIKGN